MSNPKHTLAPWQWAEPCGEGCSPWDSYGLIGPDGHDVLWADQNHCDGEENGREFLCVSSADNARLIVAAPDLLAACKAGALYSNALKVFQDQGITGLVDGTDELERLFNDWHDKTHAAIGKAQGVTP